MRRNILFVCCLVMVFGVHGVFSAGTKEDVGGISILSWQYLFPDPTTTPGAKLLAEFTKKYPDIKLDLQYSQYNDLYTRLKAAFAPGQGPDVFGLQVGVPLKEFSQFLEPVGTYVTRDFSAAWKELL